MVVHILTFYAWVKKNSGDEAEQFRKTFSNDIERIPQRMLSSIMIRDFITINTIYKDIVFKRTFLEYTRQKLEWESDYISRI